MLLRDEIDQLLINAFETDGTIRQYVGNRIGGLKHVREADVPARGDAGCALG